MPSRSAAERDARHERAIEHPFRRVASGGAATREQAPRRPAKLRRLHFDTQADVDAADAMEIRIVGAGRIRRTDTTDRPRNRQASNRTRPSASGSYDTSRDTGAAPARATMQCAPAANTLSGSGSRGTGGDRPYCARPGPVAASRISGARALPQTWNSRSTTPSTIGSRAPRPGDACERLRSIGLAHQAEPIRAHGQHPRARSIGVAERRAGRDPAERIGDRGDLEHVVVSTPVEHRRDVADREPADGRRERAGRRGAIERQRPRGAGLRRWPVGRGRPRSRAAPRAR